MNNARQRNASTTNGRLLRISLPLLLVSAVSITLVGVVRPYVQYQGAAQDVSAWGAFFTVFGVVYTIVAGFLLVTVLNRYSSLSQIIEDELNAIESIRDFLVYLGPDHNNVARSLPLSGERWLTQQSLQIQTRLLSFTT